ncbi:phosphate ABC transporter substrate-binding protein [Desulfofalx alkaliphila]|uniref:phosphate ABC transporter substrate-binding protein n=1 Tax=Desulfofalx alkaliphila TaxID=105483 RepID=UPI0004E13602|nr:phosphate ABC transporter substrate-binding protein [Desulfofalx alkaliphila]
MKRIRNLLVMMLVMGLVLLAGCAGQSEQPGASDSAEVLDIKLGGSSTLSPVIAKCADDFTEKYKTWNNVDPSLPEEPIVIFVSTGGSGFGARSAIDGTFDMGLLARDLKDTEKESLSEGVVVKLGSDALTIAVHPENPVLQVRPDLTTEEVKKIFAGEIKTWKELDDQLPDRPIVVAVRDLGGGASEVFDENVMQGTPIAKDALQMPSMGALAGKVMENKDAIGYVSYGFVGQNEGKIAVLSVDGYQPTAENINSGDYKISRPLLLVTKDVPTVEQQLFIDYLESEEGMQVLEGMGFIPAVN